MEMFLLFLLKCSFFLAPKTYGFLIDESIQQYFLHPTAELLDGLGFEEIDNLSDNQFLTGNDVGTCSKLDLTPIQEMDPSFYGFPEFQRIYIECLEMFSKNSTCLAACILHSIIKRKEYGYLFLEDAKANRNTYYDKTKPYPHKSAYDLNVHYNIFCFSKDYRSTFVHNFFTCELPLSLEVCLMDEEHLHCDPHLGNCEFDNEEVSILTNANKAHPLTCGALNTLKWSYFEKSTKFQCLLPKNEKLLNMARPVFNKCDICADKNRKKEFVIEYSSVPTKEEFSKVAFSKLPIVIRNGATSENMPLLNFSIIKKIYDDFENENKKEYDHCEYAAYSSPFDSLRKALSQISDDATWNSTWYLSWKVCHPDLLTKFRSLIPRPKFLPDDDATSNNIPRILAGTPGDGVFYHIDYDLKPTVQAQLSGKKYWFLRGPPECSHVCTRWAKVAVNQGDLMIIATNTWYHETFVENGSLSIAYTFDYDLKSSTYTTVE